MKKIILPFIIVLSFLACSDPECFELTVEQKEWLPYDEGDTISFVSSDSIDSVAYVVSKHVIREYTSKTSKEAMWHDICIAISYFKLTRILDNTDDFFDSSPYIHGNGFNYGPNFYININDFGHLNPDSLFLYSNLEQQDLELISGKIYTAHIVYDESSKERGRKVYYAAYNQEKGIIAFKMANRPDIRFELME